MLLGVFKSIWSYRLVKLALATAFLALGAAKLTNLAHFAATLAAFDLLPAGLVLPLAVVLSLMEVIAALGLLLDVRGFLNLVTGLTIFWLALSLYGLGSGLGPESGYGPGVSREAALASLAGAVRMDIIFLALAVYLYAWRRITRCRPLGIFAVSPK